MSNDGVRKLRGSGFAICNSAAGFSLLETVVAVAVLFLALLMATQLLLVRMGTILLQERQAAAEEAAETALQALMSRSATELPADARAPFVLNGDRTITVSADCPTNCDWFTTADVPASQQTSAARGLQWSQPPDASAGQVLVRRWAVASGSAQEGVRQFTVVVLTDAGSRAPLSIRQLQGVGRNRQ